MRPSAAGTLEQRVSADDRSARRRRRRSAVGRTGARFPVFDDVEDPPAEPAPPEPAPPEPAPPEPAPPELPAGGDDGDRADDEVAAPTGARFGAPAPRRHAQGRRSAADTSSGPIVTPGDEPETPTGARFGPPARRRRRHAEHTARAGAAPDAVVRPQASPGRHPGDTAAAAGSDVEVADAPTGEIPRVELDEDESSRVRVRPYVRTRGRTRARTELAIETLVSVPVPRPPMGDPEHLAVERVCDEPRSVAEVAALLEVPLGVARVLIDDMAADGLLNVHRTAGHEGAPPLALMRRVLQGLHQL